MGESNRLNNFAISSAGVGDALQRSAAALHAAGNDIDESIGMIVAANNVAQDPDMVGNALKTLSLRIVVQRPSWKMPVKARTGWQRVQPSCAKKSRL